MRPEGSARRFPLPLPSLAVAALLVLLAAAPPATAADGRLELNAACVAEGCFANDGPGFPITITDGGSYVLTSNLQVGDLGVSAIEILAGGVTLDLNGFAVRGVYLCGSNPPNCDPGRGAAPGISSIASLSVVRNGLVEMFGGTQVFVSGALARIEDLQVRAGGNNGIQAGIGSVIRNNLVEAHRLVGIRLFNTGLSVPVDGLVEGNLIRDCAGGGIEMAGGFAVRNSVGNSGTAGLFSSGTGYSQNRFQSAPAAGVSAGDNICGAGSC